MDAGVEVASVPEVSVTGVWLVESEGTCTLAEASVVVVELGSPVVARPESEVVSSRACARTCPQSRKPESVTSATAISKKVLNLRISALRLRFLWQHRPCTRIALVNNSFRTPE